LHYVGPGAGEGEEDFRQPLQTPPALRSRVKGRIAARAEKLRPGRRLPISVFSHQNFSFSACHMNPALHDNTWIGCGTSLLWDAAALNEWLSSGPPRRPI